nr:response regulator [Calditerricola satsumensis]
MGRLGAVPCPPPRPRHCRLPHARRDGLSTVRRLRALDPDVPILVLTVEERTDVAARFLEAGATDFAVKPVKRRI